MAFIPHLSGITKPGVIYGIRVGAGAPSNGLGQDGELYINTSTSEIYGPKTAGSWGSPFADPNLTAAELLSAILGIDGAGSGIDSDLLDGQHGSYYLAATNLTGTLPAARLPAFTGDITTSAGASATTLATVNANVGSYGSATQVATFTVNAKGLTTAAGNVTITPAWGSITSKPTTLSGYGITDAQGLDAGLTSLAGLTGAGVVAATATDTFVMRAIGVASSTDILDRSNADTRYALKTGDTIGGVTISAVNVAQGILLKGGTANAAHIGFYKDSAAQSTRSGYMGFVAGNSNIYVANEMTDGGIILVPNGTGSVTVNGSLVWHASNDGAGSTLDADLLDGQHGSYYQNAGNLNAGTLLAARMPALTGDITTSAGAVATTLATVNSNVGSYGSATQVATFTVNAKGLTTAAGNVTITPAWSSITSTPTTLSGYGITDAVAQGGSTMTGALTLSGDPTNPLHAATKQYVDNAIQGLSPKQSVHVATTANITLSGTQTIDGVAVVAGDRVLVKNQTTPAQNGIYVASASTWTRATDADSWADLVSAFTFVEEGTQGDTGWTCTVNAGGTLNTTAVTWTQFSGSATFTASNGITKSANDFQLTGQALALHNLSSNGLITRTGSGTVAARTLTSASTGALTVSNGDGVSGNPTLTVNAGLVSLAGLTGAGVVTATGTNTFAMRSIGVASATDIPDRQSADTRYQAVLGYTPLNQSTVAGDWDTKTNGAMSLISGGTNGPSGGTTYSGAYFPHQSAGYGVEVAGRLSSLYFRTEENSVWASWNKIWHENNDGAGSGLDSDLLDGQQGTYYTNAANLTGTIADARLSGTYSGINLKLNSGGSIFAVPSSGTTNASARTVFNLVSYRNTGASTTGAIVFIAPNTETTQMHRLTIEGLLYSPAQPVHMIVQGYRAGALWAQTTKVNLGSVDVQVRFGLTADGKQCVIIGDVGTVWSYPHFSITSALFSHNGVTDAYCTGWTTALVTDLTGYTNVTSTITPSWGFDGTNIKVGTNTVWHAGNDGASSGLDADLLDGQQGTYYLNAANLTGTIADARLPTTMAGKTFSSSVNMNTGSFTIFDGAANNRLIMNVATGSGGAKIDSTYGSGGTSNLDISSESIVNYRSTSTGPFLAPAGHNVTSNGNVNISKDNAWLTLTSNSAGASNGIEQAAGISIGESGFKGAAALHLTYTGDGYGHIGMGTVSGTTSLPANRAMYLYYTDNIVRFDATPLVANVHTMWHAGNHGAGSGLHADLLDGYHASSFALLSGSPTFTGGSVTTSAFITNGAAGTYRELQFRTAGVLRWDVFADPSTESGSNNGSNLSIARYSDAGANTGIPITINRASGVVSLETTPNVSGNTMWHAGNDGAGSGLDADLLDGYNADSASSANTVSVRDSNSILWASNFATPQTDGSGIRLWGGNTGYSIYMSSATNGTYGGRVSGETTSDYNMYFRMAQGTNRGFNFCANTTPVAGIDGAGNIRSNGFISSGSGFQTLTYASNARNRIWSFGNADAYGLSYFQGSSGLNSQDSIGFHFGTATTAGSAVSVSPTMGLHVTGVPVKATGGITDHLTLPKSILNPAGGSYQTATATITGAIKITLPASRISSNTMLRFTVKIYSYATGNSHTFVIGGYNYPGSGTHLWTNVHAEQFTDSGTKFTVRWGDDGVNNCVWIGETNTAWAYPQVYVTDVQVGYSGYTDAWAKDWGISFVTAFDTVRQTRSAAYSWNANNDGAGSGLDADLLDGMNTATAATASTIVARDSSAGILTANYNVSAVSGNGVKFWNGDAQYSIHMSDATNGTYGGRVSGETTSDYNMYFKMSSGTNRGFVFQNGSTNVGGIDGGGTARFAGEVYAGSGAFYRVTGSGGFYFQTHNGGWTMTDSTWVRSYGDKGILTGGTVQMGAFTVTSDRRLKKNITPLIGFSEFIDATDVYAYEKNGQLQWGVIAQEVQEGPAPHLVQEGGTMHEDGTPILTVDDHSILYALLAEVKELRRRVAELEARP